MEIIVQKYGGSSVSTVEKIKMVADKIIKTYEKNKKIVVVLSAMGDSTNVMIDMAREISKKPSPREMDMLLSTGEQVTISLLAMALIEKGYDAISFTGAQLNIRTSNIYQGAKIKDIDTRKILENLDQGRIVIVAGFQGVCDNGDYTTLGRGGSDTSAVALAVKLQGKCQVYTDVEGIYAVDPKRLLGAKKLDFISYEDMIDLADLGSKVMNFRSIVLAKRYNLPIYICSTFSDAKGTIITNKEMVEIEDTIVTGMTVSLNDIQITVSNLPSASKTLSNLFLKIGKSNISVDMISQMITKENKMNVSFSIKKEDKDTAVDILKQLKEEDNLVEWHINEDIAKISVVGLGIKTNLGVAGKIFELMAEDNIEIKMITTSETRITWMINNDKQEQVIQAVGEAFDLTDKEKRIG